MNDDDFPGLIAYFKGLLRLRVTEPVTPTTPAPELIPGEYGMRIGTANIQSFNPNLPAAQVQRAGEIMGKHCGIFGASEIIDGGADYAAVLKGLGDKWAGVGAGSPLPFFAQRDSWRLSQFKTHNFILDKPMKYTPRDRIHTSVIVNNVKRPQLPPFVIVNNHFIAGAYNAAIGQKVADRKRQWDLEWKHLQDIIRGFKGMTVFVLGDFNRPDVPKPLPEFKWLAGARLDRVGVTTTGSLKINLIDSKVIRIPGDHDGQVARVRMSMRG